jgi:hypothetical protein
MMQVRVVMGKEPNHFYELFKGNMVGRCRLTLSNPR